MLRSLDSTCFHSDFVIIIISVGRKGCVEDIWDVSIQNFYENELMSPILRAKIETEKYGNLTWYRGIVVSGYWSSLSFLGLLDFWEKFETRVTISKIYFVLQFHKTNHSFWNKLITQHGPFLQCRINIKSVSKIIKLKIIIDSAT
jgi:hypothetical protein